MLTEYQKIALQFILRSCIEPTHNNKLITWLVEFNPKVLQGEIVAIPYLSVVDALNATTLNHFKPHDRTVVARIAFDDVREFVRLPITVIVGELMHGLTILEKARWDPDLLFLEISASPALVRLYADLSDFIEQADKNDDGFE